MANKQQHLDDFLREKLEGLPNAPVGDFKQVERRMDAKDHRGVVLLLIIPLLFTGVYWLLGLSEDQLVNPMPPQTETKSVAAPVNRNVGEQPEPHSAVAPTQKQYAPVPVAKAAAHTNIPLQPKQEATLVAIAPAGVESNTTASAAQGEVAVVAKTQPLPVVPIPVFNVTQVDEVARVAEENVPAVVAAQGVANTSRWSLLASVYPNYTFRNFAVSAAYSGVVHERYEEIIRASERGGFAFNAGLDVRYNLGKGVFLSSGVGYIEMKVNGRYNYTVYEEINMTKTEPDLVGKTESVSVYHAHAVDQGIVQSYRYLQVPFHVIYQTRASKKLMVTVEGGMSYVRFLGADGTTIDHQTLVPTDVSQMRYNKNLTSADFKVGISYEVAQQVAIGLQPSLMYFTNSIYTQESALSVVPWSVGVNFNISMRLY